MEQKFSLELLLSITSNYQLVSDNKEIYRLMKFVFKRQINDVNYPMFINKLVEHLIKIHEKELKDNYYDDRKYANPLDWLIEQKIKYGDYLLVCEYGKELSSGEDKNIKRRVLSK